MYATQHVATAQVARGLGRRLYMAAAVLISTTQVRDNTHIRGRHNPYVRRGTSWWPAPFSFFHQEPHRYYTVVPTQQYI